MAWVDMETPSRPRRPPDDAVTNEARAQIQVILSVPVGPDRIIWNLMRIYGKDRLARLIDGYDVVESIGFDATKLDDAPENLLRTYEPAFVLRVPHQICMQEDFWCSVFGLPITSLLRGLAVALVAGPAARSLRAGAPRGGAKVVINAVFWGHGAGPRGRSCSSVCPCCITQRPPRPRAVDFGPREPRDGLAVFPPALRRPCLGTNAGQPRICSHARVVWSAGRGAPATNEALILARSHSGSPDHTCRGSAARRAGRFPKQWS